jgi:hypothetical protein
MSLATQLISRQVPPQPRDGLERVLGGRGSDINKDKAVSWASTNEFPRLVAKRGRRARHRSSSRELLPRRRGEDQRPGHLHRTNPPAVNRPARPVSSRPVPPRNSPPSQRGAAPWFKPARAAHSPNPRRFRCPPPLCSHDGRPATPWLSRRVYRGVSPPFRRVSVAPRCPGSGAVITTAGRALQTSNHAARSGARSRQFTSAYRRSRYPSVPMTLRQSPPSKSTHWAS